MRLRTDKQGRLIIEEGVEDTATEIQISVFGWVCVGLSVYLLAKAVANVSTIWGALIVLILVFPILGLGILLVIPRRYYSNRIIVDRLRGLVVRKSRWFSKQRTQKRDFSEFTAVMILEDKVLNESLGLLGPRWRLLFCLGTHSDRRRVIYIEDMLTARDAAEAAQEISNFTDWPIEFLRLDRTLEATDVNWESW